jgi:hypothetical protein
MAKQTVNIGVEGNDATGDSIRDAFSKVNTNFSELYAVFGQGGTIRFTALSDTPDELGANKIPVSNDTGSSLLMKTVEGGTGILIDNTDPTKLVITNSGGSISSDLQPTIGGYLNGSGNYTLGNIGPITDQSATDFNTTHSTQISIHDLVTDKKYNDNRYQIEGAPNRMRAEPADGTEYAKVIGSFVNNNAIVSLHGYDHSINGQGFKYTVSLGDAPAANLTDTTVYYLRYVNANQLSLHPTATDAVNNTNKILANAGAAGNPGGTHTLTDNEYNSALYGSYLTTEALPRSSTVRRQGDDMTGPLYLHDHPGNLAGSGTPNDVDDLQAASKFYVDNSSFTSIVDLYVRTNGDDSQQFSPVGKEGRSLQFAYKSIGKAAEKAEELIETSPLEPGAYVQTVTYNNGASDSSITAQTITSPHTAGVPAATLLRENLSFIKKEIVAYVSATYPTFQYNEATCERDMGLITQGLAIDIEQGLNANSQAILAGKRYFSSVSGQIARTTQKTETLAGINYGKTIINTILQNGSVTPIRNTDGVTQFTDGSQVVTSSVRNAVLGKIDIITNIIDNGLSVLDTTTLIEGSTVTLTVDNGGQGYVDQGAASNVDILPGKILRGKTTGALGRIVKYTRGAATDELRVFLIEPKLFSTQEKFEYGNFAIKTQICIHIESGIYEEDYPIKLPANCSIKGTDFRRTIIRPKPRGSQSKWINTYFFRDAEFDGLDLIPIQNLNAVAIIKANKEFIKDETIAFIDAQVAGSISPFGGSFVYNKAKCERDTGIILEGIAHDIKYNGNAKTYLNAGKYYNGTVSLVAGQEAQTAAALAFTRGLVVNSILPQASYTPLQSITSQTTGLSVTEAGQTARVTTLMQSIENVITNGLSVMPDLVDPRYGYHYTANPTLPVNIGSDASTNPGNFPNAAELLGLNKEFIIEEVIAWINAQVTGGVGIWSGFTYNEVKCRRDTGLILDAHVADLKNPLGGRVETLAMQAAYYSGAVAGQEQQTTAAINIIKTITPSVFAKTAFGASLQSNVTQNTSATVVSEAGVQTNSDALIDCVVFAFDASYNPPKNNLDIDVFMMNDSNRIMNTSMQGHGGFAQVLDPDGQILIKSPYVQVNSSFSRSANKQAFRGGMYIDNFVGNSTMTVNSKDDAYTLNVSSGVGSGLRQRRPQTPCPFFIDGIRYQVDAVTNYDQAAGTATLFLNPTSGIGGAGFQFSDGTDIVLQTAGNTSMLANDYTQVNDLGYGIVVNNGALTEQVSTFSYYCHAAYMANNGSQIRSLNGSNSNGNYGLVASGSDPNEVIDQITLEEPMVQTARVFDNGVDAINEAGKNIVYVYNVGTIPTNVSELEIDHGGSTDIARYEISSIQAVDSSVLPDVVGASRDGKIYKLSISGNEGLAAALTNNQKVIIRALQNFIFDDLENTAVIRPSTAIVFDEQDTFTYRTISFGGANSIGTALPGANQQLVTFDSNYDYIRAVINQDNISGTAFAGTGTTHGATVGDVAISIDTITEQAEIDRLNNGDMIFGWDGKIHRVLSYAQKTGYAILSIEDVNNINDAALGDSVVSAGLQSVLTSSNARTIRVGLNSGENAGLTVNISVARATGHDFNDIGTGGFNTSNYPSKIYGAPQEAIQANEVSERGKGRVFYVSTDQDGFFRVGRFFTVDQGTGRVTFAASIALSNLDGIGFKRGVVITEFSSDDGMTDNAVDSAPTESAVRGYVNRRLGIDEGSLIVSNPIGAGFISRDGTIGPSASINFSNNNITGLGDPGADFDGTNKRYVDGRTPFGTEAIGSNIANRTNGDILLFDGTTYDNATPVGDIGITFTSNTADFQITAGAIINADVNTAAQIAQSKLNLNAATTRANATGITQNDLGSAAFDNVVFSSDNGFISIDNGQLPIAKLANIADEHVIGRATGDSSDGDVSAIPFSTIVNSGGTFTTIGAPSAIVKTHTDGSINVQGLDIDSARIIDTSGTTVNFTNPGTTLFLSSQTTGAGVTNNAMTGNLNIGASRATQSNFQSNSTFADENFVAADWAYHSFIEAPGEADANSTGIGIGAGTGFSNADQISFVTDGDQRLIVGTAEMLPGTTSVYNLGSASFKFNQIHAVTFEGQANTALYADLAENYLADTHYETGTVLVFGGEQELTTTDSKGDTRVAGVVSENPGYLMNAGAEGDHVTAIALQGRVPVLVLGEVKKGDMLVTSAVPGYAIVNNTPGVGQVIGKAVKDKDDPGHGIVEAVVGRV